MYEHQLRNQVTFFIRYYANLYKHTIFPTTARPIPSHPITSLPIPSHHYKSFLPAYHFIPSGPDPSSTYILLLLFFPLFSYR